MVAKQTGSFPPPRISVLVYVSDHVLVSVFEYVFGIEYEYVFSDEQKPVAIERRLELVAVGAKVGALSFFERVWFSYMYREENIVNIMAKSIF